MLAQIITWLGPTAAPVIVTALVALGWRVISATYLTIVDSRLPHSDEEWAAAMAKSPKLAAINSIMKTSGENLPGTFRGLRLFFTGKLPKPVEDAAARAGVGQGVDLKAVAVDTGKIVLVDMKNPPPDPPKEAA